MTPPTTTPSLREQLRRYASCKHFTGMHKGHCAAGVFYDSVRVEHAPLPTLFDGSTTGVSHPCLMNLNPAGAVCDRCVPPTEADLEAEALETERILNAVDAGRSPCCNAALDERAVVADEHGKRIGPRYCASCGKWVDRLCNVSPPSEYDDDDGDMDDDELD